MKKRIVFQISVMLETGDSTPTDAVLEMLGAESPAIKQDANGEWWLGIKLPNVVPTLPKLEELGTPN